MSYKSVMDIYDDFCETPFLDIFDFLDDDEKIEQQFGTLDKEMVKIIKDEQREWVKIKKAFKIVDIVF